MMRDRIRALLLLVLIASGGCGGARSSSPHPVNFAYELGGEAHQLAEHRRRPVMLVLMRTSEIVSQIFMKEVERVYRTRAGDLRMVVLTVEPGERPFVEMYAQSEELSFPIGVADPGVALGASPLGTIPAVPVTYLLDREGHIVYTATGVVGAEVLTSEIDELLDF